MRSEGQQAAREWAYEEFGHAELGDTRRTDRIVRMVASLAEQPGGKVLDVFRSGAERQAAYDLLANPHVRQEAMLAATEAATVRRCASAAWVHVVVDGTSLRLPDLKRKNVAPPCRKVAPARPDPSRRVIDTTRELRRLSGVWFDVAVGEIPAAEDARVACFDVIERRPPERPRPFDWRNQLRGETRPPPPPTLWQLGRYAVSKRQLSKRELRAHDLSGRERL